MKVYEQVKKVIVEVLKISPDMISPESRFMEDLGADSLDKLILIMALEDGFQGNILDNEAEQITTVGETVEFITKKMIKGQENQ